MTEFSAPKPLGYTIPDDLTLAQFFLDAHHPARTIHPQGVPWFVQDETGREVYLEEARAYSCADKVPLTAMPC